MKRFYISDTAHEEYKDLLSEARTGVNLTEGDRTYLDDFFSPLLKNGQSIHHIYAKNKNKMIRSEKSIYRYVKRQFFR